jgi:hypothetical protein
MSAIVNDRDALLQAAPMRSENPKQGKSLLMSASSSVFKVTAGVAAPAAIAINVSLIGLNGTPVITVVGASRLIGSAGLTRTLAYEYVTSDVVEVTAKLEVDGQTYTATQTIVRVTDGKKGDEGLPGKAGSSVGRPRAYQWSISGPPAISGASTYTWSSGTYDTAPAGWSSIKPPPPTKGATLYEAEVALLNSNTAATSVIDWSTASLSVIGYVGLDGQPGLGGPQGASALIAYCLIDGNSLNVAPAFASVAGYNLPTTGTWGESRAWQQYAPTPAAGQSVFQSNGIFNPATGNTVWSTPYQASAKFGSLSAQSTNTGDLTVTGKIRAANGNLEFDEHGRFFMRSAETGERTVQEGGLTQVFNEHGALLMRLGTWR